MTTFTIDSADHIAAAPGDCKPEGANHFSSQDDRGGAAFRLFQACYAPFPELPLFS